MIYSILGNSPHLSFGPEAFTSVLLGQSLISEEKLGLTKGIDVDPRNTASVLTFMSGLFCILVGAFRGGFIENVLSGYLLVGFIIGVATLVMIEQVPQLLGLPIHSAEGEPMYKV
jgi:MFS superfamily sulfate permease-like transporter